MPLFNFALILWIFSVYAYVLPAIASYGDLLRPIFGSTRRSLQSIVEISLNLSIINTRMSNLRERKRENVATSWIWSKFKINSTRKSTFSAKQQSVRLFPFKMIHTTLLPLLWCALGSVLFMHSSINSQSQLLLLLQLIESSEIQLSFIARKKETSYGFWRLCVWLWLLLLKWIS